MSRTFDHERNTFLRRALALCLALAAASPAGAQAPVARPLRVIVPVQAGGTSDSIARLVVPALAELGAPVVIENRTGASGRIAGEALARAAPDGTTLLLTPIILPVLAPLVFKDLPFDPARDFAPVVEVARYPFVVAVANEHPARTLLEFIAWTRANPARANFGTQAAGSMPHLIGLKIAETSGIRLEHIPYRGVGQVETGVLGGDIALAISALGDFLEFDRSGRMRILAVTGAKRAPQLPLVPTLREQGIAFEATGWTALFAPAGTPKAWREQVASVVTNALRDPRLRDKFLALGLEPAGSTPDALAALIAADVARWAPVVKASGFVAQ